MATVAEDLRTFLLADATISGLVGGKRIHRNQVPQKTDRDFGFPFIWFAQAANDNTGDTLAGNAGGQPFGRAFDIEVVSDDIDKAADLMELVSAELRDHRGTFGAQTVQAVFVDDQDEDYIPRGTGSDKGLHVLAIRAIVIPR